jgi:hypothetical protein
LRNFPAVEARQGVDWPRMADFTQLVTAAEKSLGMKKELFLCAYQRNRENANAVALEGSPDTRRRFQRIRRP